MYERYSEDAQSAIDNAIEAAKQLDSPHVGTEHLMLGILKHNKNMVATMLSSSNISEASFKGYLQEILGETEQATKQPIGMTPRARRAIDLARKEARGAGYNYIDIPHIFLGILREGTNVSLRVLAGLGVSIERVLSDVDKAQRLANMSASQHTSASTNTPVLNQYSRDLTAMAQGCKIDPVLCREPEIRRVIQILSRRTKNNPCFIGEPGVGKTAIAEGLAHLITAGRVPEMLKNKRVITLDLSAMVAGAKYRGEFEDRIKKALGEVVKSKNIILFIDEIHTIIGAGSAEGSIDAANIMKPLLARGELQVIGATTLTEYRKHFEKDAALARRFQPIIIGEPTTGQALLMLKGIRDKYEAHHGLRITDEALVAAVNLSDRYITDRFLPDKAIDLIDEAASYVRLELFTPPEEVRQLQDKLDEVIRNKEDAIRSQKFEDAATIRDEEKHVRGALEALHDAWLYTDKSSGNVPEVTEDHIADIITSWTSIPIKKLLSEEGERLLKMEKILHERVIGQDEAVTAISKAIRRGRTGIKDPKRPVGSFIFLGPTGVGKTELCKSLAEVLFGDDSSMIRFDMSEYMEKHSVSRLVGSPPGYVGYEEGGQLTEKVRRKPYSVVLFDEIEKAHPDVFNILLQILDDGRLTDSQGRIVDFRNTVVIMTSNTGARMITEPKMSMGFGTNQESEAKGYEDMKKNVMSSLKDTFRPEFLNRIDDVIVFHTLSEEHMTAIVDIMLTDLKKRLLSNGYTFDVTPEAKAYLASKGYDKLYGARPLRRTIQNLLEDKLAESMLSGTIKVGQPIMVELDEGNLKFV